MDNIHGITCTMIQVYALFEYLEETCEKLGLTIEVIKEFCYNN